MIEAEILSREGLQLLGAVSAQSLDGKSRRNETAGRTQLHVEVLSEAAEPEVRRGGGVNPVILRRALPPATVMSDGVGDVAAVTVHLIRSHDLVLCKTSTRRKDSGMDVMLKISFNTIKDKIITLWKMTS